MRQLPLSPPSDEMLYEAAAERRAGAAQLVWSRFSPLVRGLLIQSLGSGAEVDDLAQDVFLTFFRRIDDIRDPSALRSFIVGITLRVARGEYRRQRVRRWFGLEDVAEPAAPDTDHEARQAVRRLYAILDCLDVDARHAFILRYAHNFELTEVAEALDCSLATAKRRLAKASARIRLHARHEPALVAYIAEREGAGDA